MTETNTIEQDERYFPLVLVTMPSGSLTDDAVAEFIDGQRKLLARGKTLGMICDARQSPAMPAKQRSMWGEWLKESEPIASRLVASMGIVVSNPLVRGALTAVLWIRTPPYPVHVCASLAEAAERVGGDLRKHGIDTDPRSFVSGAP